MLALGGSSCKSSIGKIKWLFFTGYPRYNRAIFNVSTAVKCSPLICPSVTFSPLSLCLISGLLVGGCTHTLRGESMTHWPLPAIGMGLLCLPSPCLVLKTMLQHTMTERR